MSNLVLFLVEEELDYVKMKYVSQKIVRYCLKNDVGSIFNFLGYSQELIEKIHPKFYFSISDDFLQLNSEFLTTSDIEHISGNYGKEIFLERFLLFDDIYKILYDLGVKNVKLLISVDSSITDLDEFVIKKVINDSVSKTLYDTIIETRNEYAYDFPNVIMDLSNYSDNI